MIRLKKLEVWFVTGSQHLYGPETLKKVAEHSKTIAKALNDTRDIPVRVVFKPVLTTPDAIHALCREANSAENCIGLVCWMHTFSPAKMWIAGLTELRKPFAHLHTQYNRDIPWATMDMDFMNLNQSAHGDREFGFICTRLRKARTVVVGHWQEPSVQARLGVWARAAAAWHDTRNLKVARFGDNMRQVAVTEGDKVEAQVRLGYEVNGYGVGELVKALNEVTDAEAERLCKEYEAEYTMAPALLKKGKGRNTLRYSAKVELALKGFLEAGGFGAFTDTFEDLYGLEQLPGMAVQRLMAAGYGFGAEGDWKHAALVRALKVMGAGLPGGASFMEDYTYHFHPDGQRVLGAHMLEVCPSTAAAKPSCEVHPLGIGGKDSPVRLVFTAKTGPAVNVSLLDMGNRFRLLCNTVDVVKPEQNLPKLPVARALWAPRPDLTTAAAAWIYAGGAHHTGFSQAVTAQHISDYAEMAGIELLHIDEATRVEDFKNQLRWNDAFYSLRG